MKIKLMEPLVRPAMKFEFPTYFEKYLIITNEMRYQAEMLGISVVDKIKLDDNYMKKLKDNKFNSVEQFINHYSSDDYRFTWEQLREDIYFYIDELLGYNDVEEPITVADDELDY